jgi:hypothetical protein
MSVSTSSASTSTVRSDRVRESLLEVPGARADIGDDHPGLDVEHLDHRRRALPFVALGIVEDRRPVLGVREPMNHRSAGVGVWCLGVG